MVHVSHLSYIVSDGGICREVFNTPWVDCEALVRQWGVYRTSEEGLAQMYVYGWVFGYVCVCGYVCM